MKFAIFTHVVHTKNNGSFYAYSPYVREMNIWLKHADEVKIVAPALLQKFRDPKGESPPNPQRGSLMGEAYKHSCLYFTAIPNFNLLSFYAIIKAVFRIPIIFFRILRAMRRADHLHLRCPGNIGLIACVAQIFFPGKPKTAKYAGNWNPNAKQPWSYRLQKWILSNTFLTRNMNVLVYGKWPNQSVNVLPFFTASFSEHEKETIEKRNQTPYKFLFVGNLVPGKQPLVALQIVQALKERNINVELHIYGEGQLMNSLRDEAVNKAYIHLHGNQPLEKLKQAYKDSHFLILASKSEGWPKAVAEAMFFGCIPVATPVSCVPWMLNYGRRGILLEDGLLDTFQKSRQLEYFSGSLKGDPENVSRTGFSETLQVTDRRHKVVQKIIKLINDPLEMRRMSLEAQEWSQEYTLEWFEEAIKKVLKV